MGVENYLLLRIGDASFPRQQLQFDGTGDFGQYSGLREVSQEGRIETPECRGVVPHRRDVQLRHARGLHLRQRQRLQSRGTDLGNPASTPFNLAGRAFYDLYLQDPVKNEQYKGWGDVPSVLPREVLRRHAPVERRHHRGARLNVARSEQEIWENMYDVDPQTPGLIGYWKFDEGEGNVIRDWTGNGNDGVAEFDLEWPSGIEVPQLNKE